eukprot:1019789-Amphidinium_carterae.1
MGDINDGDHGAVRDRRRTSWCHHREHFADRGHGLSLDALNVTDVGNVGSFVAEMCEAPPSYGCGAMCLEVVTLYGAEE